VVAAGSIIVERKFVHLNGLVGHIEDIAVDANQQGKKFGIKIIEALKYIGENTGCYKGKKRLLLFSHNRNKANTYRVFSH
jgi:glucosamine-phosphate N-acetyltransferase